MMHAAKESSLKLPPRFHAKERTDPLTGNRLITCRHESGFKLKLLPRPGFAKSFAAISVPYGSIHTSFEDEKASHTVPEGTAHFLEHCVFTRDEHGGLFGQLSEVGASANAYTSHTHTLYYFSAVRGFGEALSCYLDAIRTADLSKQRIASELPVILAELDQYHDDPEARSYLNLIQSLYTRHPVRHDIGGTKESVSRIDSNVLSSVWSRFYQPGMLTLTLTGDLDCEDILPRVSRWLDAYETLPAAAKVTMPSEPTLPSQAMNRLSMDVAAPSFLVGIKDPIPSQKKLKGHDLVARQKATQLALDCLLSSVSDLREKLFSDGLIHESFDYHYSSEKSFAFALCGGESQDPEKAALAVRDALVAAVKKGLPAKVFEIQKRAAAGDFVAAFDSIEQSGMIQARCNLDQIDLFDYPAIYDKITCAGTEKMIEFMQDPDHYAFSVLLPRKDEGESHV